MEAQCICSSQNYCINSSYATEMYKKGNPVPCSFYLKSSDELMPFLLPSQCAKRREAKTPFSIAGAVCAAPTLALAAQGTAISGELAEGCLSRVCVVFSSQCSSNWATPQVKRKHFIIPFNTFAVLYRKAASEYCQLCPKRFQEALGLLSVGLHMLTWGVGGLYLPPLGFSQASEFMCRRRVLFFLHLMLP